MIEERTYRKQFSKNRFRSFVVNYKDTDLWVGVDHESFNPRMIAEAERCVRELRTGLENYLTVDPAFGSSFVPVKSKPNSHRIVTLLSQAAQAAQTGPMAAVAGAFSELTGRHLLNLFSIRELVLENGGDIFLNLKENLLLSVHAGNSPLSGKIAIEIPASETPLGVCTSAGTVGPSISFGRADAVMVSCRDTARADALATALGNRVKTPADIPGILKKTEDYPEVMSVVIICGDQLGIRGQFKMKLVNQV